MLVAILSNGCFDGIYEKLPAPPHIISNTALKDSHDRLTYIAVHYPRSPWHAPAAIVFIPWAAITGDALGRFTESQFSS